MKIFIISLFPEMFDSPFAHSIIKRAIEAEILDIEIINPRDFAFNKHSSVDDYPFGGGAGMVIRPEPLFRALEHIAVKSQCPSHTILLSPSGRQFTQSIAAKLAEKKQLVFICGHYEGIDERVRSKCTDEALSIGDYVLTGGELPTMVIIEAVARLIDGVLGCSDSHADESFSNGSLEYPQYTRPRDYRGLQVPDVLVSGDHAKIDKWRREQSARITRSVRPDLLECSEE